MSPSPSRRGGRRWDEDVPARRVLRGEAREARGRAAAEAVVEAEDELPLLLAFVPPTTSAATAARATLPLLIRQLRLDHAEEKPQVVLEAPRQDHVVLHHDQVHLLFLLRRRPLQHCAVAAAAAIRRILLCPQPLPPRLELAGEHRAVQVQDMGVRGDEDVVHNGHLRGTAAAAAAAALSFAALRRLLRPVFSPLGGGVTEQHAALLLARSMIDGHAPGAGRRQQDAFQRQAEVAALPRKGHESDVIQLPAWSAGVRRRERCGWRRRRRCRRRRVCSRPPTRGADDDSRRRGRRRRRQQHRQEGHRGENDDSCNGGTAAGDARPPSCHHPTLLALLRGLAEAAAITLLSCCDPGPPKRSALLLTHSNRVVAGPSRLLRHPHLLLLLLLRLLLREGARGVGDEGGRGGGALDAVELVELGLDGRLAVGVGQLDRDEDLLEGGTVKQPTGTLRG